MKLQTVTLALLAFVVGNSLPHQFTPQSAQAAPADVVGSANVAVDTYRNPKGTFIVWADGRITNAELNQQVNPSQATSASYDDVGGFPSPTPAGTGGNGSPHVAVRTVSGSDATYVLFSDGRLRKPHDPDAALPQWSSNVLVFESGEVSGSQIPPDTRYDPDSVESLSWDAPGTMRITLRKPLPNMTYYGFAKVTSGGTTSSQGISVTRQGDRTFVVNAANAAGSTSYAMLFFFVSH